MHSEEVSTLMDQMMKLEIFSQEEKINMSRCEKKLINPNIIMDARHETSRRNNYASLSKCVHLTQEKRLLQQVPVNGISLKKEQDLLDKKLKRFEKELHRSRPKFRGPYVCTKKNFVYSSSEDEIFWKVSRKTKDKLRSESIREKTNDSREENMDSRRKINESVPLSGVSLKSEGKGILPITKCEMPYFGSIKITLKEKLDTDSKKQEPTVSMKCLDPPKTDPQDEQLLQEIQMKLQQSRALRLQKKYFYLWQSIIKRILESRIKTIAQLEEKKETPSDEMKIEMFIQAITEKQKELMKNKIVRRKENASVSKSPRNLEVKKRNIYCKRNPVESPAQHRLREQKRTIKQQKAKLAEQNRIIEDLRLKQTQREISKAEKETVNVAEEVLTLCGREKRKSMIQLMRQAGYRTTTIMPRTRTVSLARNDQATGISES